jgi:hypothetical protein
MKFTLVFHADESTDVSYGLLFIPCPVWVQGDREVVNLNPERPDYRPGSLRRLLETEGVLSRLEDRRCALVIQPSGYGSDQDLQVLIDDLAAEGFSVTQVRL